MPTESKSYVSFPFLSTRISLILCGSCLFLYRSQKTYKQKPKRHKLLFHFPTADGGISQISVQMDVHFSLFSFFFFFSRLLIPIGDVRSVALFNLVTKKIINLSIMSILLDDPTEGQDLGPKLELAIKHSMSHFSHHIPL
jgi:hypothetical protein